MPDILSPFQITVKGAPAARRLLAQPQTLDCALPGKTIGTYRLDGAVRAPPSPGMEPELLGIVTS